jgi:hypothetical protein
METNIKYEKLSAYVDGELSPEERDKFEEEIALSRNLQIKLDELRKLKQLTAASTKKLPESPYFETRLFASLESHKSSFFRFNKLSPFVGFALLTILLMVFLKFNPQVINRLVEQQKTNLAGFYKQNLKPLLYAANLSNEDIFNFAFENRLPLDKNNSQYLQLGYDTLGKGYFEIKTGNVAANQNNLEKFIAALDLNPHQKVKVDSMLQAYAEELQTQVLVNDKNTVAINPDIWNYKKAILADIIAFAQNANSKEFSKICPVDIKFYNNKSFVNAINEIKKPKNNNYIFFTPDTIFSEPYAIDKKQFKEDFLKMKEQMKSAKQDWEKMAVNLNLVGRNVDKIKHAPSWSGNFTVQIDKNTCRVNMPNMVQEIPMPDFDSIMIQVERATDVLKNVTINIPDMPEIRNQVNYNYRINVPGHSREMKIKVDLDSALTHSDKFNHQFYSIGPNGQINVDSLVESLKSMLPDSLSMKEFQVEMKKFQKQMIELQKELQKNNKTVPAPKKPIEI